MTASCARSRAVAGPRYWLSAALLFIAIVLPAAASSAAPGADPIIVRLDHARILQLPERAATIVVGNPLIADLTIQSGGLAVVTGKGYGATNFVVLDRHGVVLTEQTVEVTGSDDPTVVVYRGIDRETYSCAPDCSRRVTLGDMPEFFDKSLAETVSRNAQATSMGGLSAGH